MHVLEVVVELVKVYVHLLIVKANVLCHVVQIYALVDQVMIVMVLCVTLVVVVLVEEIVLMEVVHLTVLLTDVIPHVLIGVITCVHKEHHVELLLVRPQAEDIIIVQNPVFI